MIGRMQALPAPVVALLEGQHGVAARVQLLDHVSSGVIDGMLRKGVLVTVERGVYRLAGSACPPEQRAMAAVLRARPRALATGPFVLGVLHVDGMSPFDPFEILTHPERRLTKVDFLHRPNPTPAAQRVRVGPVPTPMPAAALVDTGRFIDVLGERRLRVATDSVRWKGLATTEAILARARELGRQDPGAAVFLDWNDRGLLVPESPGERVLGDAFTDFKPRPESQVWILKYRLDWYWRLLRFGLEYFGRIDHVTAEARLRDTERFHDLKDAGIRVAPVVREDLDDLNALRAWVRSCLIVRATELGIELPAA